MQVKHTQKTQQHELFISLQFTFFAPYLAPPWVRALNRRKGKKSRFVLSPAAASVHIVIWHFLLLCTVFSFNLFHRARTTFFLYSGFITERAVSASTTFSRWLFLPLWLILFDKMLFTFVLIHHTKKTATLRISETDSHARHQRTKRWRELGECHGKSPADWEESRTSIGKFGKSTRLQRQEFSRGEHVQLRGERNERKISWENRKIFSQNPIQWTFAIVYNRLTLNYRCRSRSNFIIVGKLIHIKVSEILKFMQLKQWDDGMQLSWMKKLQISKIFMNFLATIACFPLQP